MHENDSLTISPTRTRARLGWVAVGLILLAALALPLLVLARNSSSSSGGSLDHVWGQRGITDGRLQKPRAIAIDGQNRLFIVDKSARIQVFDPDGNFLYGWKMPDFANGKPTGLSFDHQGHLLVADTHYFRVMFFTPEGRLLPERTMGGQLGHEPGQFGLVTDVVQDSQGCYYVAEYGEYDRIQKFSEDGRFLLQWGGHGSEPGQFIRPQNMAVDRHDHVWVVDACNHRVQVFDATGEQVQLIRLWGQPGSEAGQLKYPYDLILDDQDHVYICEFGNHRIQKFTLDGKSIGSWGRQGRQPGQLFNPWALAQDNQGRIHVLDTYNHRVQRIRL